MRTTLNLDDDVAAELGALARRDGRSMSRVANDLMREGLRASRGGSRLPRYEPPTFDTGSPLVDVTDVAAALEVLDRGT
ncbi:MAG: CopG family transcriptional regulator [Chloroflexi bacterium]|nr:CopG family transcriptional regulator [Chloroflexota bacterium]